MKWFSLAVWLLCSLGVCAAPMGIVVPAYFYPGSLWSSMDWAARRVPVVAIMNRNVQSLNQSAPATELKFLAMSNGVPSLRISGAPGVYELQTTSNLLEWSAAANVSGATNQIDVMDITATNAARRLYRTRQ